MGWAIGSRASKRPHLVVIKPLASSTRNPIEAPEAGARPLHSAGRARNRPGWASPNRAARKGAAGRGCCMPLAAGDPPTSNSPSSDTAGARPAQSSRTAITARAPRIVPYCREPKPDLC
jgi:hypothetical protein